MTIGIIPTGEIDGIPTFRVEGRAQTAGGMPVDRITIFDMDSGAVLWSGGPIAAVAWNTESMKKSDVGESGIGIAYFSAGYGLVAHGPYAVGEPVPHDAYWHGVFSLLRFEGEEGQTWFFDDAGKEFKAHDGAALTTRAARYGNSALSLPAGAYLEHEIDRDFGFHYSGSVVEAWVRLTGDQGGTESLVFGVGTSAETGVTSAYFIAGDDGASRNRLGFRWGDGKTFAELTSQPFKIPFDRWVHVAWQAVEGRMAFFVDGTPIGVANGPPLASSYSGGPARIGRMAGDVPMQFVGLIDSMRVRYVAPTIYAGPFVPAEILPAPAQHWSYLGMLIPCVGAAGSTSTADVIGAPVTFEGDAHIVGTGWHNGRSLALGGAGSILVGAQVQNDLSKAYAFSFECWLSVTEMPAKAFTIFDTRGTNAAAEEGLVLSLNRSGEIMLFDVGAKRAVASTVGKLQAVRAGPWYHVTACVNGYSRTARLMINGFANFYQQFLPWDSPLPKPDPAGWRIGRSADGADAFKGRISDIRVFVGRTAYDGTMQLRDTEKPFPQVPRYRA